MLVSTVTHIDVFHDQVVAVLVLIVCLQLNNVGMVQRTHHPQLTENDILKSKDLCFADSL